MIVWGTNSENHSQMTAHVFSFYLSSRTGLAAELSMEIVPFWKFCIWSTMKPFVKLTLINVWSLYCHQQNYLQWNPPTYWNVAGGGTREGGGKRGKSYYHWRKESGLQFGDGDCKDSVDLGIISNFLKVCFVILFSSPWFTFGLSTTWFK